jgi:phosphoglycerate dehydrogenase-like enzyme
VTVGPILVYYPDPAEAEAYARGVRAPRGATIHVRHDRQGAGGVIGEVEILYAWGFPASLLARAPRLRWVQAMGAGVDRFLVPELDGEVRLTRAPVFGPWMVEYVFGWCLWITQKMDGFRAAQRERRWTSEIPERLRGRTLAIVGLGDIGRALARAARAFALRVVGVSLSGRRIAGIERAYRTNQLPEALATADFAVLAVPLTPETRGLVGERELQSMKPSAWLLNIARGPVVQEAPLVEALRARRIAGAVLDVFDQEPLPPDHPLWALPNVVITPHIAGPSVPGEITAVFNENLRRYARQRRLLHLVDRGRGY